LLSADPHCMPAHVVVTGSGTQPQKPLLQSTPASHEPQSIGLPQLSVVFSQRPSHQVGFCWHLQTFEMHCSPVGQVPEHARVSLQLSGPVPQCVSHQLGFGTHPALPSTPGPPSADAPPSPGGSIVMTSEKLSSPIDDASPRGVPLSIPSSDPHASGAHTTRPRMPASAKRPKDMQTPRTITSKAIIHGPRPATRSKPRLPCRTPPTYAPMRAFFRDSR
jgi:hypothetical protein